MSVVYALELENNVPLGLAYSTSNKGFSIHHNFKITAQDLKALISTQIHLTVSQKLSA